MSDTPTASPVVLGRWEKPGNLASIAALAAAGQVTILPHELIRTTDGRVYHWTGSAMEITSAPVHHGTVADVAALDGLYLLPTCTRGVHPGDTAYVTAAGCEYRVTAGVNATATWSACAIGADPSGTAATAVSTHNTAGDSHADIRTALAGKQDAGSYLTTTGTAADSAKLGGVAASGYSQTSHTHNYAGSATPGGAATYAGLLEPLSGPAEYKLGYTADGACIHPGGAHGRVVMHYAPTGDTYGVRVDRADMLIDSGFYRITHPSGGASVSQTHQQVGAIAVQLPVGMSNTMCCVTVKVFDYVSGESFEIHVCGYNYSADNSWRNPTAYIVGNPNTDRQYTVRLGYDSTAGKAMMYIGELSTVWDYPQIYVTEVLCGFAGYSEAWTSGWQISFEASAFKGVTATITDCQVGYKIPNPSADGYLLSSTAGGVRSWVAPYSHPATHAQSVIDSSSGWITTALTTEATTRATNDNAIWAALYAEQTGGTTCEIPLAATDDGSGVLTIRLWSDVANTATLSNGAFYGEIGGTTNLGQSVNMTAGQYTTFYIKLPASTTATLTITYGWALTKWGQVGTECIVEATNAPKLNGLNTKYIPANVTSIRIWTNLNAGVVAGTTYPWTAATYILFSCNSMTLSGTTYPWTSAATIIFNGSSMTLTANLSTSCLTTGNLYLYLAGTGIAVTYPTTRTWPTTMRQVYLRPSSGSMVTADVDRLFIDVDATCTTASGEKILDASGNCGAVTSASDVARTSLVSKGFAVSYNYNS